MAPEEFAAHTGALGELLADTVAGGASLGFRQGLTPGEAADWWCSRAGAVARGELTVRVALDAAGRCVGTVSLAFTALPNGRHRAEIAKLMVGRTARGGGLGRRLLSEAERDARRAGITLLVLDTETDSAAEQLYRRAGWTRAGQIPDYATDPAGALRPTTLYYKRLGAQDPLPSAAGAAAVGGGAQ
ncbi:GNAT family N-acetyltransferase [Streptomyces sp. SID5785]|uniref:GNAT family N-acetyltransferase n=1 Tax=Streptomyces sp. SID5785 TaxID=2690309 RepID=UPI00136C5664|nr:GNAT family N-acetyltransferase [Streptomyces sp. SID5785]